jgi:hypothetical protein
MLLTKIVLLKQQLNVFNSLILLLYLTINFFKHMNIKAKYWNMALYCDQKISGTNIP